MVKIVKVQNGVYVERNGVAVEHFETEEQARATLARQGVIVEDDKPANTDKPAE